MKYINVASLVMSLIVLPLYIVYDRYSHEVAPDHPVPPVPAPSDPKAAGHTHGVACAKAWADGLDAAMKAVDAGAAPDAIVDAIYTVSEKSREADFDANLRAQFSAIIPEKSTTLTDTQKNKFKTLLSQYKAGALEVK